jgi:putative transposase
MRTLMDREGHTMISFKGSHFEKTMILNCVRWYVSYSLSYRNLEEMMAERGVEVDHSSINRWVIKYSPQLEKAFRNKHKRPVGKSWRMDETYIKIKGKWYYLYRAVDKEGKTVDFLLCKHRDKKSASRFFKKAIGSSGIPEKVTIDKSGSNNAALKDLNLIYGFITLFYFQMKIRQIKYLNNIIEQDHRGVKRITKGMLGFKSFNSARATLYGIELAHMIKKDQMENSGNLPVWEQFYVLAA